MIKKYEKLFNDYTASFIDQSDTNCFQLLKKEHSVRVAKIMGDIAEYLEFNQKDVLMAKVIGLYHDYGRFEQYAQYGTFIDKDSIDHGCFGSNKLKETSWLNAFDTYNKEIILFAIKYHNKFDLPPVEDSRRLLFSRLIRDADKLDIFNIVLKKKKKILGVNHGIKESSSVTESVIKSLLKNEVLSLTSRNTYGDYILLMIDWMNHFSFNKFCFNYVKEQNYIESLFNEIIPSNEEQEYLLNKYKKKTLTKLYS